VQSLYNLTNFYQTIQRKSQNTAIFIGLPSEFDQNWPSSLGAAHKRTKLNAVGTHPVHETELREGDPVRQHSTSEAH
jgi:hypothetical protein